MCYERAMTPKTMFCLGSCGTALVVVCCVTPLAVIVLGAAGLGIIVPALDFILLPSLVAFVAIAITGWIRMRRQRNKSGTP